MGRTMVQAISINTSPDTSPVASILYNQTIHAIPLHFIPKQLQLEFPTANFISGILSTQTHRLKNISAVIFTEKDSESSGKSSHKHNFGSRVYLAN